MITTRTMARGAGSPAFKLEEQSLNKVLARLVKGRSLEQRKLILQKTAMHLLKQVILETPVGRTGQTRASWAAAMQEIGGKSSGGKTVAGAEKHVTVESTFTEKRMSIRITNHLPHFLAMEYGRRAYVIRPVAPGGYKKNPFKFPSIRQESPPYGWLRWIHRGEVSWAKEVSVRSKPGTHSVRKAMQRTRGQLERAIKAP